MVAPVSGGRFPRQLAIIRELTKMGYEPTLVLCSSGGNVANYLAMAAHWDPVGIDRVVRSICSKHFVKSWFPSAMDWIPSMVAGFFLGAIYKSSDKATDVFQAYFTPENIIKPEVWMGTINQRTSAVGLFCNKAKGTSIIKGDKFDTNMFKCEELKYLDGDVNMICKCSIASSSIPTVVEPQEIYGEKYIDGGTKFASPAALFCDELCNIRDNEGGIHIMYVNGYNVDADMERTRMQNIIDQGLSATEHIVRGFILHDRMSLYSLIRRPKCNEQRVCYNTKTFYMEFDGSKLKEVYARRRLTMCSLLEIYPTIDNDILDYTNFEGEEIVKIMNSYANNLACRMWWHGEEYQFIDIVPNYRLM